MKTVGKTSTLSSRIFNKAAPHQHCFTKNKKVVERTQNLYENKGK